MSETTEAARLTNDEIERHVCCVKPRHCTDDHFHQRDVERIIAARTPEATTTTLWRINGPEGPSYAIDPGHEDAEVWSRKVAALTPGRYVESMTVTTYRTQATPWQPATTDGGAA